MKMVDVRRLSLVVLFFMVSLFGNAEAYDATKRFEVAGVVRDKATKEPLAGATILVEGTDMGAIAGMNGEFVINNVSSGKKVLDISFVGYDPVSVNLDVRVSVTNLEVELAASSLSMNEVVVVGKRAVGSVNAVLSQVKYSPVVANGISSQQISKTSDRDASEVVKRIPGITILGDRYVIVRGLAQRYNNVWLNGAPAPSTEADGRVFSFDILPSSQIGSMMVYKAPAPEYPADFAGGFVAIETKNMPTENSQEISISTGFNTVTHFNKMRLGAGSKTDFIGFDNSKRPLSKDFPRTMRGASPSQVTRLTQNGFNNDWSIKTRTPLPDIRLSYAINNNFDTKKGVEVGNITAINYSNTNKSNLGMVNNRYGIYSAQSDKPILVEGYIDDSYSNDVRVGVMHNWAFKLDGYNRIEFRNLFNQLAKNRLIERKGTKNIGSTAFYDNTEMLYNSRLTYTGQLAGNHRFGAERSHNIDWNASYSYANMREPDRRIVTNSAGVSDDDVVDYDMKTANQSISRYFQELDDNILSLSVGYKKKFEKGSFNPTIKAGVYADLRDRNYTPREFTYRYTNLSLAERQEYLYLPYEQMMQNKYLGADKVFIDELSRKSDAYTADSHNISGYVGADLPVGAFNFYIGARYEYNYVSLVSNTSMDPSKDIYVERTYPTNNILPSVNITYNINQKNLLRLSYGESLNRPEFRELSPSIYYDFDTFAEIAGNPDLKTAHIRNIDFRYEMYPASGETISVGVFYKNFKDPIEWTFIDMGGSLRYCYENAQSANNYGVEVEIRKALDFIKMPNLSVVLNGAYIKSNVKFKNDGVLYSSDRPLQGQSPYIVNAALFYQSEKLGLMANLQYNIIGKRIIGIGKSYSSNGDINSTVPDSYEMPRNVLDLSVAKKLGKVCELKLQVKDILAQDIVFKQFPQFEKDGATHNREQVTRQYNTGTSFQLGLTIKL